MPMNYYCIRRDGHEKGHEYSCSLGDLMVVLHDSLIGQDERDGGWTSCPWHYCSYHIAMKKIIGVQKKVKALLDSIQGDVELLDTYLRDGVDCWAGNFFVDSDGIVRYH